MKRMRLPKDPVAPHLLLWHLDAQELQGQHHQPIHYAARQPRRSQQLDSLRR
jgi:hypothetical protein